MGPDNISPIMLKHLGPLALKHIAHLFTNTVNQAIIPPKWKVGRIIPILKPGKPADEGPSYRPISLLSLLAKTLESIIWNRSATLSLLKTTNMASVKVD